MSHAATNWAIQQRGLKPTTKIVLWHLADRFNPDFGCFPSQDRLAHDCEISRSTLNAHLALLEAAGLLRRVPRIHPVTRRQMPTRYILGFEPGFTPPDPDPCPKSGLGSTEPSEPVPGPTPFEDDAAPAPDPRPETGHGNAARAVSDSEPDPCPKNAQSRVRNPDTNPVREPLREPVKVRGGAQAPDVVPDILLADLLGALGFDPDGPLPGLWQGAPPRAHLRRWRDDLGLSAEQIIRVARETRKEHPTPPDGPRALDRAMERAARRNSGCGTPARRLGESMCDRSSGNSAPSRLPPSAKDVTAFYAELINSDRFLPASMISNTIRDLLLASGLVTAGRLRERGIA
jgi:hypothetical protein